MTQHYNIVASTIPLILLVFFTYQTRLKKPQNQKLETQNKNKSKKPSERNLNFKTQKVKSQWKKHDRGTKDGKSKEQDIKTHNIGWTKNRIQQQTKLKPHRKEKTLVTNYIVNIKHQDSI